MKGSRNERNPKEPKRQTPMQIARSQDRFFLKMTNYGRGHSQGCPPPMPPVVPGALGFVRWDERTSSDDTGMCPVRVTSVLPSGEFHCDFVGRGGQHSIEPLAADRLIDRDDAGYDGLGSNADAPTTQSRTAAHGRGRAATNSASALPTGEHRCWQVDDPDGTSGALTVPAAGGQLCLAPSTHPGHLTR